MNLTEIQEFVYVVRHAGKIHLDTNCKYLRHKDESEYTKRPSEAYPEGHVDLCSWCEEYFAEWDSGISIEPSEKECERCGKRNVQYQYCGECIQQIALRR